MAQSHKYQMQLRRVDSYAIAKTSKLWVFPLVSMEKLAMTRKLKKGACKRFGSYSLRSELLIAGMDVSRCILVLDTSISATSNLE